jgi:hypothetical protein
MTMNYDSADNSTGDDHNNVRQGRNGKHGILLGTIINPNLFLASSTHIFTRGDNEFYRLNNVILKYNTVQRTLTGMLLP